MKKHAAIIGAWLGFLLANVILIFLGAFPRESYFASLSLTESWIGLVKSWFWFILGSVLGLVFGYLIGYQIEKK